MSTIAKLKAARDRSDLALIIGTTPSRLAYALFKIKDDQKYTTFEIPKKNGGMRTIKSPHDKLAALQKLLSDALYECTFEFQEEDNRFWMPSHGFRRKKKVDEKNVQHRRAIFSNSEAYKRTIVSNADAHKRCKFVFNIDIQDFFESINFGRVRGFFIKDKNFKLNKDVATAIAQIACHNDALPQGSPCSPVISNLIGGILDSRLVALANKHRCNYTRYADDITFSTNDHPFPRELAVNIHGENWLVGDRLKSEIERAGFRLNPAKTRMSLRQSRQTVTGLTVNEKPNINQNYYRDARAMCDHLFRTGSYFRNKPTDGSDPKLTDNLNPLEGILSHINFVKSRHDRDPNINKYSNFIAPSVPQNLYRDFLFYRNFVALKKPIIVCEGITDITYLRCAILSLGAKFPSLISMNGTLAEYRIKFLKPSGTVRDVMKLGQGSGGQAQLIAEYKSRLRAYKHKPLRYPVIILCDNDDGLDAILKKLKKSKNAPAGNISKATTKPFYHLQNNLYLVKVPEGNLPSRDIEDLFPAKWLGETIDGKPFDKKKEHGDSTAFGKSIFADKIVKRNVRKIDFTGFTPLLERLDACVQHHENISAPTQPPQMPSAAQPSV